MSIVIENRIRSLQDLRDLLSGGTGRFYAGWSADAVAAIDAADRDARAEPVAWATQAGIAAIHAARSGRADNVQIPLSTYPGGDHSVGIYTAPPTALVVPEGWKLVPLRLDKQMASAFIRMWSLGFADARMAEGCWDALLAAAPELTCQKTAPTADTSPERVKDSEKSERIKELEAELAELSASYQRLMAQREALYREHRALMNTIQAAAPTPVIHACTDCPKLTLLVGEGEAS